jgi:hypothetical protein
LKRIILSATVVAPTAAMLAGSSWAVTARENGRYATDGRCAADEQYARTTAHSTIICAPWSKSCDISNGRWVYAWYRWCVDPSLYDPSYESNRFIEWGDREWGGKANLCLSQVTATCLQTQGACRCLQQTRLETTWFPRLTAVAKRQLKALSKGG